ncbi:hypothetical protein BC936DRAFT_148510 [Jimgerdemannia flammicorona]|uniref:Chorismate-utilising enzyme C-terminal domain-containing protein n=1 Tax=Jimgerdemannia flammicorona TaxID=994334 RepID=A0A433D2W9_9FUNG|nr:hypothetical protein BC936DRAFT_148510 [Jimgerdemannia flammicorona]
MVSLSFTPSSVGHFDYSGGLDTCIAIRTILHKDGVCYLQGASRVSGFGLTGGGIVYDSVEEDEFHETINKLDSNLTAISQCEIAVYEQQQEQ